MTAGVIGGYSGEYGQEAPWCYLCATRAHIVWTCLMLVRQRTLPTPVQAVYMPYLPLQAEKEPDPHAEAGQFLSRWMYKSSAVQTAGPPRSKRRTEAKSRPIQALVGQGQWRKP